MNYKRAALEQLDLLPRHNLDRESVKAIVYAILSLGQTDEAEAVVAAAINYCTSEDEFWGSAADRALKNAVADLIGQEKMSK